jgi:hypothetical protein
MGSPSDRVIPTSDSPHWRSKEMTAVRACHHRPRILSERVSDPDHHKDEYLRKMPLKPTEQASFLSTIAHITPVR